MFLSICIFKTLIRKNSEITERKNVQSA